MGTHARDWQWSWVNLMASCTACSTLFRACSSEQGPGSRHIVNTASIAGWLTAPLMVCLQRVEAAVVALSGRCHHALLAQSSLGVSVFVPGLRPDWYRAFAPYRPAELLNADARPHRKDRAERNREGVAAERSPQSDCPD